MHGLFQTKFNTKMIKSITIIVDNIVHVSKNQHQEKYININSENKNIDS